jgi:hypothetical protein
MSVQRDITVGITDILLEHGFDDDEEVIEAINEFICDYFGIARDEIFHDMGTDEDEFPDDGIE